MNVSNKRKHLFRRGFVELRLLTFFLLHYLSRDRFLRSDARISIVFWSLDYLVYPSLQMVVFVRAIVVLNVGQRCTLKTYPLFSWLEMESFKQTGTV